MIWDKLAEYGVLAAVIAALLWMLKDAHAANDRLAAAMQEQSKATALAVQAITQGLESLREALRDYCTVTCERLDAHDGRMLQRLGEHDQQARRMADDLAAIRAAREKG